MPDTTTNPLWKRRDFLRNAAAATAAGLTPSSAAPDRLTTISLIHTTDLHGNILPTSTYDGVPDVGGFARCATLIRRWRKENPDHLLLDIGDVYQGTHLSRSSSGRLMGDLFNQFRYDAWILGNHEFDWGIDVVRDIVGRSSSPVLTANVELDGKAAGQQNDKGNPFSKIAPWMIREVAGFKIGVAGIITPGLSYWLPPQLTKGVNPLDPAPIVKSAASKMRELGADAVVVCGHMGTRFGKDDFANRVDTVLSASVGNIDAFIAGHTHRDLPSMNIQRALYTQAGYHGIYLGRVDLTFDRETRKLVDKRAFTVLMDDRFDLDPLVIERAKGAIEISENALSKPVGRFADTIPAKASPGEPSGASMLAGAAIKHALNKKRQPVDAIVHGQFVDDDIAPGEKTLADLWTVIPYENRVVTASLTVSQLKVILEEMFATPHSKRNLLGTTVQTSRASGTWKVTAILDQSGQAVADNVRLRVGFNSYDARSGGQRFMKLRAILEEAASKVRHEDIETRAALVDYLADKGEVTMAGLAQAFSA